MLFFTKISFIYTLYNITLYYRNFMQTNLQRSDGNLNIELNNNEIKTLFQSGSSKVLLPNGPSIFKLLPFKATLTFSGIDIFIFPILDIKIPYK